MNKLQKNIFNILIYSFIGILIWIILQSILNYNVIIYKFNPVIIIAGVVIYIGILIKVNKKLIDKLMNINYVQYILFGIFFVICLVVGYNFRVQPSWDMGSVYEVAKNYALTGAMGSTYLVSYPNNIMITIIYTIWFKIMTVLNITDFILPAIFLNSVIITATVALTYYIALEIFEKKRALMILIIMMFTTPLYLYAPIFYTDTLSMFFSTLLLFLFTKINKDMPKNKKIIIQVLFSLTIVVAWKVKITSIFIVIAMIVYYFIKGIKKEELKNMGTILAITLVMLLVYNFIIENRISDRVDIENYKMPIAHWIMLGLSDNGGFNQELYEYTSSFPTYEEKKSNDIKKIQEILTNYDLNSFVKHLTEKLKFAWTDGTYFAPEKLRRDPVDKGVLHEFVLAEGKYNTWYKYFPQIMHIGLLVLIVASSLNILKKKEYKSEKTILLIAMYGLIVFLLLWENRSRYILTMLPIFILLGIDGIEYIENKITKRQEEINHNERRIDV